MQPGIFFLLVFLVSTDVCQAETLTGTQLLNWCQTDQDRADTYIDAFDDTARVARSQADESAKRLPRNASMYDELYHRYIGRFCFPKQQKIDRTTIVCRWLAVHHDLLSMPAPKLIAQSYQVSYPCLDE